MSNTIINFHAVYDFHWMEKVFLLLKNKYNLISLSGIHDYYFNSKRGKSLCHITFDDGDISFYEIVFPLLKKHNIPLSIYVSPEATLKRKNFWFQEIKGYNKSKFKSILLTSLELPASLQRYPLNALLKSLNLQQIWLAIEEYQKLTKTPPKSCMNMDINQLKELYSSGFVSIGAHTQNHPILKNENDETAKFEIQSSVAQLSEMLGTKIEHFAYPNGQPELDFGERETEYLNEAGIKLAFSTENKRFSHKDDPLAIPRNGLSYGSPNFVLFKLIMGSKWDALKRITKGKQESDWRKLIMKEMQTHKKGNTK